MNEVTDVEPGGPPGAGRRLAKVAASAAVVGLPWLWFAVRDLDARLDYAALVLPLLAVVGLLSALAGLLAACVRRRFRACAVACVASWFLFGLLSTIGPRYARPTARPTNPVRILAANVADREDSVLAALQADDRIDVVVLSESTGRLAPALRARLPYVHTVNVATTGLTVASRYPLQQVDGVDDDLFRRGRGVRFIVDQPGEPFMLYAFHLPKAGADLAPWSRFVDAPDVEYATYGTLGAAAHRALAAELRRSAEAERLPTVVAGDFNSSDRGGDYRALVRGRRDAMRSAFASGTSRRTALIRALSLRIDHLVVPNDWCAADAGRVELPGSDHWGIVASVGRCPG